MKFFAKFLFKDELDFRLLYILTGKTLLVFIFSFSCLLSTQSRPVSAKQKFVREDRVLTEREKQSPDQIERGDRALAEQANQTQEQKARGLVLRFHRWPSLKEQSKLKRILKSSGLKRSKNIKIFKAQLFAWEKGGLKPSKLAETACSKLKSLSYLRRCSPDHLLSPNTTNKETEAGFNFECEDCKNQGVESIGKAIQKALNLKTCDIVSHKRELMNGRLSDYWAQKLIGSDLLREELKKTPAPNIENWIEVFDSKSEYHNIHVKNLISDEARHGVLPENEKISFLDTESRSTYAKGYRSALSLYETSYPGDYLFAFKKRAPHYINNSMGWIESKDIYEVFKKLSSAKISPTVIVVSSGNSFPKRLDNMKTKASQDFDMIIVGSFSYSGFVSNFSQSSKEVSILAPSDNWITSAGKNGGYKKFGGTSGAAPLVTGSLAGFEWLSGYHPTAKEAKILLEKTALPTLHSFEKPPNNGVGLLNAYKLGEVAKRLKEKCEEKIFCFKKEILKDENYQFEEDKNLSKDLVRVFPACSEKKKNLASSNLSSDCEEKKEVFKRLRKEILLNPSQELLKSLSCIYKKAGFTKNAEALEKMAIALGTEEELRKKMKARLSKKKDVSDDELRLILGMGGFEEELNFSELTKILDIARSIGERALPLVEKAFATGNRYLQYRALISAGEIGEKALPLVEKAFATGNRYLQDRALISAGEIGEKALPLVEKAFATGDHDLQDRALISAGKIGEKALPLVEKGFATGDKDLQYMALRSAGEIGEKALPLVEKGFATGDKDLQYMALDSAIYLKVTVPWLKKILKDQSLDETIRYDIKRLITYKQNRI